MTQEELVDVVNDKDEVIGTELKQDVYRKGLSNRIVHVFVVHPDNGTVFIQRRSATVGYLPNFYCTSAGGHVGAGEEYYDAASRELAEELGLSGDLHFVEKFIYNCDELIPPTARFISLYLHYARDGISYADGEVSGGTFVTIEELSNMINANSNIHPQLPSCLASYMKFLNKK